MAKLTVLVALVLALAASASAYTTVVTTTIVDGANPERSCQTEMQQRMPMMRCMQWMQEGRMGRYGTPFLRSAVANPEDDLHMCCGELNMFSPECRCDALRRMMMEMQKQYGEEQQMQEMMRAKARSLPKMCGMKEPSECHFQAVFV